MKNKLLLLPLILAFFTGIANAQMTPEDDIIPAPYRAKYQFIHKTSTAKWDSNGIYKYYFKTGTKKINTIEYFMNTGSYSWLDYYTVRYYYNSTFNNADSVAYYFAHSYDPHDIRISSATYFRDKSGQIDSLEEGYNKALSNTVYYYNKGLLSTAYLSTNGNLGIQDIKRMYFYDSNSRVSFSREYSKIGTKWYFARKDVYAYDSMGRITEITTLDTSNNNKYDSTQRIIYDNSAPEYTGISAEETPVISTSVYPNPFHSSIFIRNNNFRNNVSLSVMDLTGRTMIHENISAEKMNSGYILNLEYLPAGIYILLCNDGEQISSVKIVKY